MGQSHCSPMPTTAGYPSAHHSWTPITAGKQLPITVGHTLLTPVPTTAGYPLPTTAGYPSSYHSQTPHHSWITTSHHSWITTAHHNWMPQCPPQLAPHHPSQLNNNCPSHLDTHSHHIWTPRDIWTPTAGCPNAQHKPFPRSQGTLGRCWPCAQRTRWCSGHPALAWTRAWSLPQGAEKSALQNQ